MTDYALQAGKFVLYKCFFMLCNRLVAARAFYRDMFAFQFELCFIVVKALNVPVFQAVTARAIDNSIDFKLTPVLIFMTTGTSRRQPGKLAVSVCFIRLVTSPAILLRMSALQREGGFAVIKPVLAPVCRLMTLLAGLVRIPFGRDFPHMDILMAIHAALPQSPKNPLPLLLVAGDTRRSDVGAFQRKFCFFMVFQRKQRLRKPLHGMTFATIWPDAGVFKFAFVVIRMTGSAGIVRDGFGHTFRDMAFPAIHRFVFSFQFKSRPVVVESA